MKPRRARTVKEELGIMSYPIFSHRSATVGELFAAMIASLFRRRGQMSTNVTVQLQTSSAADFDSAIERIRKAGLKIDRVLPRLRVISGSISDEAVRSRLMALPEVSAVEKDELYHLDPSK